MKRYQAFSLIEISVVIVIIGILIVGVAVGDLAIKKARLATALNATRNSVVPSIRDLSFWAEATAEDAFDDSANTDSVATWYDINTYTTEKNNATQSTSGSQPTYIKNAINGLPALRFDGVNDYLTVSGTVMGVREYSLFLVEQRRASTSASYFYATGSQGVKMGYSTTIEFRLVHNNGANDFTNSSVPAYSSPIPRIISVVAKPASSTKIATKIYFNGALQLNDPNGRNNYGIAAAYNIGLAPYNGDIGEIIIFKRCLKPSERVDIEQYLSQKWRIDI